jgi:formylglycine-generating enzyme required for sulfatase activity
MPRYIILSILLSLTAHAQASRIALLIGNGDYQNAATLANPVNDAKDMAAVLENLGFQVTVKLNASKRTMKYAVRDFGQRLQNGDVALFYYSGHGLQSNDRNYLVPQEADIKSDDEVEFEGFDAKRVLRQMERVNHGGINIMILDACRNNPFQTKDIRKGLAKMKSPVGSLIAYATAPDMASYGDNQERNSIYTKYLLKALREKPWMNILDLLTEVTGKVVAETGGKQIPWKSDSLRTQFCFGGCSDVAWIEPAVSSEPEKKGRLYIAGLHNAKSVVTPQPNRQSIVAAKVFRDRLQDGSLGPEMVWIPGGSFKMGDLQGDSYSDEKPVHSVTVKRFAMGRVEVTFAEYDKFAEATGRKKPKDNGWGRGNRPVINISWEDATAYAAWLSQQTDQTYRLPTEAEWEYAARAGTETVRYWGNNPDEACRYANVHDKTSKKENAYGWTPHNCTDGYAKTAPVGSFKPNTFGLFDMLGNIWEWTCSEYENKYRGKEKRCISKHHAKNSTLSQRGGDWDDGPGWVRSAFRLGGKLTDRSPNVGLRLVRVF